MRKGIILRQKFFLRTKIKIRETGHDMKALIVLALSFIYLSVVFFISEGLYGDADSLTHFYIARYAFVHPELLVNHWGKPLFTILCAPFAQAGYGGAVMFNIFAGTATAWLVYLIARHFNYRYAILAIPFTLFAPVYMVNLFTCLTEILFSLVLVAAIYTFLKEKFIGSAVIISLIPFARTEGLMFIALFLVALAVVRQYRAIPFLATGFIVFSIAGYFHYKDLLWFFTANPYSEKGSEIYGSGSFMYYLERFHQHLGHPQTLLAIAGLALLAVQLFRGKTLQRSVSWTAMYLLITGSLIGFILAHSFLWWQGMMGVLASNRFMACILPLGALLAVTGLDFLMTRLTRPGWMRPLFVAVVLVPVIIIPYTLHAIPARLTPSQKVMKQTAARLKTAEVEKRHLIHFDPRLTFFLGYDPYDTKKTNSGLPTPGAKDFGMPERSMIVYDPHFGEFEGRVNLAQLVGNPYFRIFDIFIPTPEYKFYNGQIYMSVIFERISGEGPGNLWNPLKSIDFESGVSEEDLWRITDNVSFSGNASQFLNPTNPYSFSIRQFCGEISDADKVAVRAGVKAKIPEDTNPESVFLVMSLHAENDEMLRYFNIAAEYFKPGFNEWFDMWMIVPVETRLPKGAYLKLYVWYPGESNIFIDDLFMEFVDIPQ